jgi:hypothetical protein
MALYLSFFFISFLGDYCAYFFYQRYVDSHKKDTVFLIYAIISAIATWFFIFKIQDRGQTLRIFIPLWAAGTAIFGYIAGGYANGTPTKELFNMQAIISIIAITIGIYYLNRIATP